MSGYSQVSAFLDSKKVCTTHMRAFLLSGMCRANNMLLFAAERLTRLNHASQNRSFRALFGSNPGVVAQMWEDHLTTNIPAARIDPAEIKPIHYLIGLNHLKLYDTETVQAAIFQVSEKTLRKYKKIVLRKIMALAESKIIWPYYDVDDDDDDDDASSGPLNICSDDKNTSTLDDDDDDDWSSVVPDLVIRSDDENKSTLDDESDDSSYVFVNTLDLEDEFIASVDGVHCRIEEPLDPEFRKNPKYYSHKFHQAALAMEVALDLFEDQVIWVNGPFPASTHDLTIFREGLKNKIPVGKKVIGDKGYRAEEAFVSTHNRLDDEDVRTFKKRALARQEAFNKRLKEFACLSGRFRHKVKQFKVYFMAVTVICQYQLENGSPLFNV